MYGPVLLGAAPRRLELVVHVGLQAAGKSSYYRARFAGTHVLVSKDLYRSARSKSRRQAREIEQAFSEGRSVVVDNTNATRSLRAELIALGRAHGARLTCCHFAALLEECLLRNAARSGRARVPDVALYATAKHFVGPRLEEGFDRLVTLRLEARRFVVLDVHAR